MPVDPIRFSAIAHQQHTFCSPLNSDRVYWLINALHLPSSARVLDAGCGKAEMLIRLIKRYALHGVGVDHSPYFLAEARREAIERIPMKRLRLHQMEMADFSAPPQAFDLGICIGSTHLFGNTRAALRTLAQWVSGQILIGDLFWRREPDPEFLSSLGASADDYTSYEGLIAAGTDQSFTPLYSLVSSQEDWDHYEWLYNWNIEKYLAAHPDDPDCAAIRERGHAARERYLRWGRNTFGFALVLFDLNQ